MQTESASLVSNLLHVDKIVYGKVTTKFDQ